jgi:hypothetical protein
MKGCGMLDTGYSMLDGECSGVFFFDQASRIGAQRLSRICRQIKALPTFMELNT